MNADHDQDDGLIGEQIDDLAATIDDPGQQSALDHILSVNDYGARSHGFNNNI